MWSHVCSSLETDEAAPTNVAFSDMSEDGDGGSTINDGKVATEDAVELALQV